MRSTIAAPLALLLLAASLPVTSVSAHAGAKLAAAAAAAAGAKPAAPAADPAPTVLSVEELREQVRKSEVAFAKTMADRDHKAFLSFLDDEAIFVGPRKTFRGKRAVAEGWKPLYDGPKAAFSWAPEKVEVVDSGMLALSSGPVFDPSGKRIGTFNSTWRRMGDGSWRIVLDNGCPDCDCGAEKKSP